MDKAVEHCEGTDAPADFIEARCFAKDRTIGKAGRMRQKDADLATLFRPPQR
jgi:hypothetical protein